MEAVGQPAATASGLSLELSPAVIPISPKSRKRWLQLPHVGELKPTYRSYVPLKGEPQVLFEGWATEPMTLDCLGGHRIRFRVWDPPIEEELGLIDAAIERMRTLGPGPFREAAEHVYRYYRDVADAFTAEERTVYEIPTIKRAGDVWQHVRLPRHANVSPSRKHASGYIHKGAAYISLSCGCAWEEEHGLSLVFIDGQRLGRVSSCDGHPTWAHACADRSLLDVVYHSRR